MVRRFYYYIWVRSEAYHGSEPLTYHYYSRQPLRAGTLVEVPLRATQVPGWISAVVDTPAFTTKPLLPLQELPILPPPLRSLALWLQQYYAAPLGVIAGQFLPPKLPHAPLSASVSKEPSPVGLPSLTAQQQHALGQMTAPDTYLLHGRTGSGKTRLYLELAQRQLTVGRSVLVITPEIGLTPQLVHTFRQVFGERVLVMHSQLTPLERRSAWQRALTALQPLVVIGPRSALFAPLPNVGLIVIDEAHDTAYKQEQTPRYHAVRVASKLSHLHHAQLVLGSATPSIEDYYLATVKHKTIVQLDQLARATTHETTTLLVDLKDRTQFVRNPYLSTPLIESVEHSLQAKEQSLLYINRRATARLTICQTCGWQARCPNCDLPLAYHGDRHELRCHTCGYRHDAYTSCVVCGSTSLSLKSFGTKAIVDQLQRLFRGARIARFDTDNHKHERIEALYDQISGGQIDILVGTQMLTKGMDLPRLSTLGILAADTSLYIPDYTARERTFQLINQVAGRVGRGHVAGRIVAQTYSPSSTLLRSALAGNWLEFYTEELAERRRFSFPPFVSLLKISTRKSSPERAETTLLRIKTSLQNDYRELTIEDPAPSFHEKIGGKYNWQLVIKSPQRSKLLQIIPLLAADITHDLDPTTLL